MMDWKLPALKAIKIENSPPWNRALYEKLHSVQTTLEESFNISLLELFEHHYYNDQQ